MGIIKGGGVAVYETRSKRNGVLVQVLNTQHPDYNANEFGVAPGDATQKWLVGCTAHKGYVTMAKRLEAEATASKPDGFCDGCKNMVTGGEQAERPKVERKPRARKQPEPEATEPAPAVDPDKPVDKLTRQERMLRNICFECGGELRGKDGHFHEKGMPVKYVCCTCVGHVEASIAA